MFTFQVTDGNSCNSIMLVKSKMNYLPQCVMVNNVEEKLLELKSKTNLFDSRNIIVNMSQDSSIYL